MTKFRNSFFDRQDPDQYTCVFRHAIQETVGSHGHVSYPADALDQLFITDDLSVLHDGAVQSFLHQGADDKISIPTGVTIAIYEIHSCRSKSRVPVVSRQFHTRQHCIGCDDGPIVIDAEGRPGPAIIFSRTQEVELTAAVLAVFVLPQFSGMPVIHQTFRHAVTEGINFRQRPGGVHKWIVFWNRAVVLQADDLPGNDRQVLGGIPAMVAFYRPLADGDVHKSVIVEGDLVAIPEAVLPEGATFKKYLGIG